MAIDDNTTYGLTGAQVKDLAQRISAGGGPTVVQTPGGSISTVMSQAAVTGMVFDDPLVRKRVQIGATSSVNGDCSVGIGYGAIGSGVGAVALGAGSSATTQGEVNIGSSSTTYGYNNSNYRLLTGLYDPQSDHDAATKGYVDTSISAIGAGTRKATSTGWNTSAPLDYILQRADSPSQAQGAMFYTGKDLSDFPRYVGIGIYSADTNNEPWPYLLTQTTSDDGLGTTTVNPAAYRMALHSELPATFTTNEWNALWA